MDPDLAAKDVLHYAWNGVLPVDLFAIASRLGIGLKPCDMRDAAVAIVVDDGRFTLSYNQNEIPLRRRFAVAHALGHVVMDHRDVPADTSSMFNAEIEDERESAANHFAMALLMPHKETGELFHSGHFNDVGDLARAFQVSKVALTRRLQMLHLI